MNARPWNQDADSKKHTAKVKSRREHSMPGQGMHVAKPGNSGMRMAVTTISKKAEGNQASAQNLTGQRTTW